MKTIESLVATITNIAFKICILGLVLVLAIPIIYIAWRANQPMELPQFDGRTYFELLGERRRAYDDLAQQYRTSHPNREIRDGVCFLTELGIEIVGGIPSSGFYALAGIYPRLQSNVDTRDLRNGFVPQDVTWPGFLPAWWETFEKFVWGMVKHAPHGPVPYCRIAP